jgi:parallel beta-helix repeat protein
VPHERLRGARAHAAPLLLLLAVAGWWGTVDAVGLRAGTTAVLSADVVLGVTDVFEMLGTAEAPCTLIGNGYAIRTTEGWTGRIVIRHCTAHGLGTASAPALEVHATGRADVVVENTVFDASGAVVLRTSGDSSVTFRRNTILETSVVPTRIALADSRPAFSASGQSPAAKIFQGNRIYRSWAAFESADNWIVGGDTPADGNVIIGNRAGIIISRSRRITVRGNYVRGAGPFEGWNQVFVFQAEGTEMLVEHNVFRNGNWLVRGFTGGEFRYNLLGDSFDRPWMILRSDGEASVHHNVFIRNRTRAGVDGLWVFYPARAPSTRVYNNTFHGGGGCGVRTGGAVNVAEGSFLASLHSNAFVSFAADIGPETAIVRGHVGASGPEPRGLAPARLGYADHNLFHNPQASIQDNYALTVAGKTERRDAGFARFDAEPRGPVDQQVDPRFAGPIPVGFPYADEDLKSRAVTVCQILRYYRRIFTPGRGSPLVDRGDPLGGAGADIGAIGAGVPHPDDRFGLLCPLDDVGKPRLTPAAFACPDRSTPAQGVMDRDGTIRKP